MSFGIRYSRAAALQIQRERVWRIDNLGHVAADGFEEDVRHALDLLADHPRMGEASPWSKDERRVFLVESRLHIYYRLYPERAAILVIRLRHEKQAPLKKWR